MFKTRIPLWRKLNFQFLFLGLISFYMSSMQAHANIQDSTAKAADSLTFEAQRARVNQLLDSRSKRFGEYATSLEKKTGVFGLFKTKKDMQKSNDILRELVINDNNIFLETRKLLDLKDAQSERYQKLATEYDQQVSAYMKTINKLQNENDKLRGEISQLHDVDQGSDNKLFFAIVLILILVGVIVYLYLKNKPKKLTV